MKTIEQKREDLKNQRVMTWFDMVKFNLEDEMKFISIKDLSDLEVSMIWSNCNLWNMSEGKIFTDERTNGLNWERNN
jgi:hypothetical protein